MNRKIVLFELNEVPWRIVEQFREWRPESHFARILPNCRRYETYAEDSGELSPWVTWPSMHRGVDNGRHTIKYFGQELEEINQAYPTIWEILTKNGVSTGVFGSLHSYPLPEDLTNYTFFVPDTFAAGSECFPSSITPFQELNLRMVNDSPRNVSSAIPWKNALQVLARAPGLGFKASTFVSVGSHLVSERMEKWKKTRRRSFQVVLAFDIFMKQLRSTRPAFATFFTNHVASSMHRYWAAAFPDDYNEFGYSDDWVETYRNEIDWTMSQFDKFLGRLLAFVGKNPDYQLYIATSMGQAATNAQPLRDIVYLVDLGKFMAKAGLETSEWERRPAMAPRISVVVDEKKRPVLKAALESFLIGGRPAPFEEREGGFFDIAIGKRNLKELSDTAVFRGEKIPFADIGLKRVPIEDQTGQSAYHIPQGCLFIHDPKDQSPKPDRQQISALEVAPMILDNYGIAAPAYMTKPARALVGV